MFTDKFDSPYKDRKIHPEDKKTLDQITQPKNWDYDRFKKAISAIGVLGVGVSIPAYNRPDTIHLQGWRVIIDDLLARQKSDGNEYARAVFVDYAKGSTFFSDKITRGNRTSAKLNFEKPVSRPHSNPIGSIHVHPVGLTTEHGLSDTDYHTFLSDNRQQVMAIAFGKNIMLALKTSATPNNPDQVFLKREIEQITSEFLYNSKDYAMLAVVNLNKQICLQFGLTLYMAIEKDRDLLKRVNVA
jgi:hypothetical protein